MRDKETEAHQHLDLRLQGWIRAVIAGGRCGPNMTELGNQLVELLNTRPATLEDRALDALEELVDHYRPVAPHQHYHGPDCPSLFAKWTDCNCATHADYRDARALLREAGRVK